jgi:putative transposase
VTGAGRREGGQCLVTRGLAQRRAGLLRQLQRATCTDQARPERTVGLVEEVHELAQRPPRYGDRRGWAWRRRRGRRVHRTHGPRLWTRAKRPVRQSTRQRGPARAASGPVQALHPGPVWTDDVLQDACRHGPPWKVWPGMDAFTREGRAIAVAPALPSPPGLMVLERLAVRPGRPRCIRRDNGPACIALAARGRLAQPPRQTLDIGPGCPWQNGWGESCNGPGRDDGWNRPVCHALVEAWGVLAAYRQPYHEARPHSRLGYRTPPEFTRDGRERQSPSGRP